MRLFFKKERRKKQKKEQKSRSYPKKIDIQKKKTWPKRRCFSSRKKRRRASELCVWMKSIRVLLSVIYSGVNEKELSVCLSLKSDFLFHLRPTLTPQKDQSEESIKKTLSRGRPKTTTTKKNRRVRRRANDTE